MRFVLQIGGVQKTFSLFMDGLCLKQQAFSSSRFSTVDHLPIKCLCKQNFPQLYTNDGTLGCTVTYDSTAMIVAKAKIVFLCGCDIIIVVLTNDLTICLC